MGVGKHIGRERKSAAVPLPLKEVLLFREFRIKMQRRFSPEESSSFSALNLIRSRFLKIEFSSESFITYPLCILYRRNLLV